MAVVARSEKAPRDSIAGDALLRRVLAAVDAQHSLAARLRYQVNLQGRTAVGSGIYLQQGKGPERQLRLELTLETPPITSRVLQVSDGTDLWFVEELAGENRISRIEHRPLAQSSPDFSRRRGRSAWLARAGRTDASAGQP